MKQEVLIKTWQEFYIKDYFTKTTYIDKEIYVSNLQKVLLKLALRT